MTKITNRYKTKDDSKLHTSYSELNRCTSTKSTIKLVLENNGRLQAFEGTPEMDLGTVRHKQWETESKASGYTPEVFRKLYYGKVDYIERAFAVEIFKDVILHFRPDVVSVEDQAVIDYKKIDSTADKFKNSYQLLVYAYGLSLHGIRITKRIFLCEKWDKNSEKILGYERLVMPINMYDLANARKWLKPRVEMLKTVNDLFLKGEI